MFKKRPKIVCLCGSTRFRKQFEIEAASETLQGCIVLTVGVFVYGGSDISNGITPHQKELLDELHKRKIDMADEVLIIDVDGYIGTSTRSEIEYAQRKHKFIRYWSQENPL